MNDKYGHQVGDEEFLQNIRSVDGYVVQDIKTEPITMSISVSSTIPHKDSDYKNLIKSADTALSDAYMHFFHTKIDFIVGSWSLSHSIHHWINDGLMAFFFFIVGLEIKREILVGELSNIKVAILPILSAIGGMALPALIYMSINNGGEGANGWGIPMATDIAFAVSALVLLGKRVSPALVTFLVALAIVDGPHKVH